MHRACVLLHADGPASPTNTRQAPQQGEVLVGTVEVSWDRSTHSTSLTLNPPKKSAYLCNMAVSEASTT